MTAKGDSIGISSISYSLPPDRVRLEQLDDEGKLESSVQTLAGFGFRQAHVANGLSAYELARLSAVDALGRRGIEAVRIDALFYASALPETAARRSRKPISLFQYPATRLQYELGMSRAVVTGVNQAGCVSLLSSIRLARDMLVSDPARKTALCVSSDVLPAGSQREILYNLISDAGCAAIVEKESPANTIVAYGQITKGFFWTPKTREHELISTYFATARTVILETLEKAGLQMSDIALILPHNVNRRSWQVLLDLLGVSPSLLYRKNVARKGHTIAADPLINLEDATREGKVRKGDYVLLFSFGFGAHWACMILRH